MLRWRLPHGFSTDAFRETGPRWTNKQRPVPEGDSKAVLCDATDGWKELRRFPMPLLGGKCDRALLEFSPGSGEWLLASHSNRIAFFDPNTGEEPPWSKCFRALALPAGKSGYWEHRGITF